MAWSRSIAAPATASASRASFASVASRSSRGFASSKACIRRSACAARSRASLQLGARLLHLALLVLQARQGHLGGLQPQPHLGLRPVEAFEAEHALQHRVAVALRWR